MGWETLYYMYLCLLLIILSWALSLIILLDRAACAFTNKFYHGASAIIVRHID